MDLILFAEWSGFTKIPNNITLFDYIKETMYLMSTASKTKAIFPTINKDREKITP